MKWSLSLILLFSVSYLKAEVNPDHVRDMLDQMVRENVISAPEAEKAKIRLKKMDSHQWAAINQEAQKVATRMPASVTENKIEAVHTIDLDGAQFKQIQKEMKKIAPQY